MGTIVVGFVPKPEGRAAVQKAIEEARLRGSRLIVASSNKGNAQGSDAADAGLDDVKAELEQAGVEHEVRHFVRGFDPAEDLLKVAEEADAELIVIGLRRRTPVGKLILGSNAQRILLDAPCAVLAVKAAE